MVGNGKFPKDANRGAYIPTPRYVRRNYAQAKARMLIREFGLSRPPVDIENIIRVRGIFLAYHFVSGLGHAVTFEHRGRYYISISPTNPGRDRWSMAHELGHVELGHFDLDLETLGENRLTNQERWVLDREADIFARDLLMPGGWVRTMGQETPGTLAELFGVSMQAMLIRLNELGLGVAFTGSR